MFDEFEIMVSNSFEIYVMMCLSVLKLIFSLLVGYLIMSDDWFSEFVYEVVIDKKFLTEEILAVTKQTPVVLPAWDPMGALAKL